LKFRTGGRGRPIASAYSSPANGKSNIFEGLYSEITTKARNPGYQSGTRFNSLVALGDIDFFLYGAAKKLNPTRCGLREARLEAEGAERDRRVFRPQGPIVRDCLSCLFGVAATGWRTRPTGHGTGRGRLWLQTLDYNRCGGTAPHGEVCSPSFPLGRLLYMGRNGGGGQPGCQGVRGEGRTGGLIRGARENQVDGFFLFCRSVAQCKVRERGTITSLFPPAWEEDRNF